jgi:large subunit ribosomal protein L9
MEVILLERIKKLGDLGDTVKIRPGYARNYLLPQGKALPATDANREVFEARKAELIKQSQDSLNAAKARAETFAGVTVTIEALSADQGKLYGSITPADVARAAEEQGLSLQKSEVEMPEGPIRMAGEFELPVRLHSEVSTTLKLVVVQAKR